MSDHIGKEEYLRIFSVVPRACVGIAVVDGGGVLLTKRSIAPYFGFWHLPGKMLLRDETVFGAAIRVAKEECGLAVIPQEPIGYTEALSGDSAGIHSVEIVVRCKLERASNSVRLDDSASDYGWFSGLPLGPIFQEHYRIIKTCIWNANTKQGAA